ncbi:hypothetical protein Tco_0945928 [Tanacetum coccineum]
MRKIRYRAALGFFKASVSTLPILIFCSLFEPKDSLWYSYAVAWAIWVCNAVFCAKSEPVDPAGATPPEIAAAVASTLRNAILRDLGDTYTGLTAADREFLTRGGLDHLAAGRVAPPAAAAPPSVAAVARELTHLLLVNSSAHDNVPDRVEFVRVLMLVGVEVPAP